MANQEKRELKPFVIISNSDIFEIRRPEQNDVIHLEVRRDKTIVASIESITGRDEQRLQELRAVANLSKATRALIRSKLDLEAAKMATGSEDISPALSVARFQDQFSSAVNKLVVEMRFPRERIQNLILSAGRQFTVGETHMGIMPPVVAEQVEALNLSVTALYLERVIKLPL